MDIKTAFTTEELHFSYEKGVEILHGVNLKVPEGLVTGILGANGCGKSTLLRLMAGSLEPTKGRISLYGRDVQTYSLREYAKQVAVVHQQNMAPQDMTVEQVVMAGRTPYQCPFRYGPTKADQKIVAQVLRQMELTSLSKRQIGELSGGQMQRVWMSMALAQDTPHLLLDEVTTYLDIHYQLEFMQMIQMLNRKFHKTEVLVLHDVNQAMQYCDYLVVMRQGRILAQGPTEKILTESLLEEAYGIRARMLLDNTKRYCFFSLE